MNLIDGKLIMLDTETTGLKPEDGHRIIEIGAVVVQNREVTDEHYHQYTQPNFEIDAEALAVHGITQEFLSDKPTFERIVDEFVDFVKGAELVIHNAPFDVGFINNELLLCGKDFRLEDICKITDSLTVAKEKHPGAKNNLDALCRRYGISNEHRTLHGALLDSEILGQVFLAMTGGQTHLDLSVSQDSGLQSLQFNLDELPPLRAIKATDAELAAHEAWLEKHGGDEKTFVWQQK